jgi:hypothetical protein
MNVVMLIKLLELVPGLMLKGRVPPEIVSQMIKLTQAKPAECVQYVDCSLSVLFLHDLPLISCP